MKKVWFIAAVLMLFAAATYAQGMTDRLEVSKDNEHLVIAGEEGPAGEDAEVRNRFTNMYEHRNGEVKADPEVDPTRDRQRDQVRNELCDESDSNTGDRQDNEDAEAEKAQDQVRDQLKDGSCEEEPDKDQDRKQVRGET